MVEGPGGAAGGGGAGTTPAAGTTPPAGGAGGGTNGGGAGGERLGTNAGNQTQLDREKLNPLLRGMSEEQVNEVFDTLFSAVKRGPDSGVPSHARPAEPRVEAPKPVTKDELREAFDPNSEKFDPQAAIDRIVTQNYGGLLNDIGNRATSGMRVALKAQFPDIDDYQQGIDQVLQGRNPAQITQQEYVGAYLMAKGAKQVENEVRERTKKPATTTPSPAVDLEAQERETQDKLSPAEEDVAKIMFRNSADPVAEFKRASALARNFKVKVPGDK